MSFLATALILGGASLLGSAVSSGLTAHYNSTEAQKDRDFQAEQAKIDREFSALEAQKNRDYQTEMSNTAYQRSVEDMRNAGLNPYAVYGNSGFSVASTPSGSASTGTHGVSGSKASASFKNLVDASIVADAFDLAKMYFSYK